MNGSMNDDLEEELINNTLKHSVTCKILAQPINNKGSLIKEPTVNNILTHPMNLINETLNQSVINNILKEPTINDKKLETNKTLKQTMVCNILKDITINNKKSFIVNSKNIY